MLHQKQPFVIPRTPIKAPELFLVKLPVSVLDTLSETIVWYDCAF